MIQEYANKALGNFFRGSLLLLAISFIGFQVSSAFAFNRPESSSKPSQIVKLVWELSEKGEVMKASEFMTNCLPIRGSGGKTSICSNTPLDSKPNLIYETKQKLNKIISERIKGERAEVVAEIVRRDGRVFKVQHELCQHKGEWRILSIYPSTLRDGSFLDE